MSKMTLRDFFCNFSYSFSSNILHTLIGAIVTFIIPKFISTEEYGYYQLYLFYINYVGWTSFGLWDGIYLRIGGQYYNSLNKPLYCSQFLFLGFYEAVLFTTVFVIYFIFGSNNANDLFVIGCVCVVAVGMCLRFFIIYILQATARIKEYAIVTVSEKILFVLIAVSLVIMGYRKFYYIVLFDALSKFISLFIGIYFCRDIVFSRLLPIKAVISEVCDNISAGFRLMLSSLCGLLIVGVVQFFVQNQWDVITFGKVSMTLNVSNMLMTAISAISVVMYPALRRTSGSYLSDIYKSISVVLMSMVFGVLTFYYPIQKIISIWLPKYSESLRYAAILMPVCVYESKVSLLINTYYKTLRLEKLLMKCNIFALIFSLMCTVVSTFILNSVIAAIFSILIVLCFRCVLSESLLAKNINIKVRNDIVIELIMTAIFIVCNWFLGFYGMLMYVGCYILYLLAKKKDIMETVSFIKSMG